MNKNFLICMLSILLILSTIAHLYRENNLENKQPIYIYCNKPKITGIIDSYKLTRVRQNGWYTVEVTFSNKYQNIYKKMTNAEYKKLGLCSGKQVILCLN